MFPFRASQDGAYECVDYIRRRTAKPLVHHNPIRVLIFPGTVKEWCAEQVELDAGNAWIEGGFLPAVWLTDFLIGQLQGLQVSREVRRLAQEYQPLVGSPGLDWQPIRADAALV